MKKEKICGRPKSMMDVPIMHCPGCYYGIIVRAILETIDELEIEDNVVGLSSVSCSGPWTFLLKFDSSLCPHGRSPAMGTAIKRIHPDTVVFSVQGDGDLGAIGLGCFMNALSRGEKLTTIMLNNVNYGMTGGQMSPTTLLGMKTTTSPEGRNALREGYPLHAAELAATMKGTAYSARVSVNTPANFKKAKKALKSAFKKQIDNIGYGFVEFLSVCPPGWGMTPMESQEFLENDVMAEYPLGEFKNVDSID
ncbi:MAG: thiamine pyrophosphate-dependent enzyme [Desulfatiglans sp.]|jgi:2-oxoglutarate ferredoxin oxidoreductase subunit beta|nr:thiamine pyrophosphate-dependent enzyme [Thermodesulfobacteriota bacterium]MEE4351982.1 thiamine pyrophosphate-dependent enzyme [Desulfatiglans sp.]